MPIKKNETGNKTVLYQTIPNVDGARSGTRTRMPKAKDFKSFASTDFAIRATFGIKLVC